SWRALPYRRRVEESEGEACRRNPGGEKISRNAWFFPREAARVPGFQQPAYQRVFSPLLVRKHEFRPGYAGITVSGDEAGNESDQFDDRGGSCIHRTGDSQ